MFIWGVKNGNYICISVNCMCVAIYGDSVSVPCNACAMCIIHILNGTFRSLGCMICLLGQLMNGCTGAGTITIIKSVCIIHFVAA